MMWDMQGLSWFWPVCAVLALGLISIGIVLFSRWFLNIVNRDTGVQPQQSALEVVQERFALDEITAEEFERLKRGLRS